MESDDGPAPRYKVWPPKMHEYFVDLCVQETLNGNKPGPSLNKDGRKNVLESLNKKPDFKINRRQLKNHWDLMRAKWKTWCKLVGTSSMKWDPSTRKFGASPEDWANYIKFNPDAAMFRYRQLEFVDKLEIIFPGITPLTEAQELEIVTEPPTQRRRLDDVQSSREPELFDEVGPSTCKLEQDLTLSTDTHPLCVEEDKGTDEAQEVQANGPVIQWGPTEMTPRRIDHLFEAVELRPRKIQSSQPRGTDHLFKPVELSPIDTQPRQVECQFLYSVEVGPTDTQLKERVEQRHCDAVESRSAVTIQSIQGERNYSIGECVECLDGMEDVEQGGNLYLFALDVFLKKEYREIFLQLKKPAIKIAWLRRLQRVAILR